MHCGGVVLGLHNAKSIIVQLHGQALSGVGYNP